MGVRLCIFKIGVTCHPARRFEWYLERGYTCMWVLTQSDSIDLIHMLEAALIHEFGKHVGCKNRPNSGGEGGLNRANVPSHPPSYTYVVGGRADQPRWVGWNYFQAAVASKLPLACGLPVDSHYLAKNTAMSAECWVYLSALSNLQTNVEAHLSFLLHHFSFLCLPALASKVPCCRVVELARAEVSGNPRPNAAVKRFAKIPVEDAEAGCHELFRELGLCAPVKVEYPTMDGMKSIPYIRISSWAQWLLDTNRLWRQFVGVGSWERMQVVLGEYWARFRELYPNHEVFTLPCDLKRTIPFYSHSDEGRTYKSKPIYVLSVHGALGRGTSSYVRKQKHKAELSKLQMGLNFIGNTWATHMMFTSVVRQFMNERTDCLDILLDIFASDCEKLITEGVTSSDGTKTVFMLHIATKGDLPALAKQGHFLTFARQVLAALRPKASATTAKQVRRETNMGK